ncbi:MAG: enoyl-CoA hydratase/isomerase family protein [Promethearchaeota archaeon]
MPSTNMKFGEFIDFTVKRRFGIITLNRILRANSFDIQQFENLKKVVEYCQGNEKIRGLIITNNGTSFSTGVDIGMIDGSDHQAVKYLEKTAADICKLLYNGKPSICAVNGRTMGEGVVFLSCCDYRIATKDSFFQMPEIFSGIFTGTGCLVIFSKVLGIPFTKKMCMFAEKLNTNQALEIGLIDKIVNTKNELMEIALDKARFLSLKNQMILNLIKLCVNNLSNRNYQKAYLIEKEASSWYQQKNKTKFLKILKKKIE